ncbi:hypothetical protein EK21DRAFT_118418 [Setomelanomma holmii]|uniref:Uncharacterized protein n=1 Tax=Setomelanomma holmii TaxID=210430 RepID=A0A9P4GXH2_9PLEO|nr:hypothetical protein EK21DRAFT_118418 [Setomelanomma holmii]
MPPADDTTKVAPSSPTRKSRKTIRIYLRPKAQAVKSTKSSPATRKKMSATKCTKSSPPAHPEKMTLKEAVVARGVPEALPRDRKRKVTAPIEPTYTRDARHPHAPKNDKTIPQTDAENQAVVARFVSAINNMSNCAGHRQLRGSCLNSPRA